MNNFEETFETLEEENLEFTKKFIKELEDVITRIKKKTYGFNDIVKLKQKLADMSKYI